MKSNSDNTIVYSTDKGRVIPKTETKVAPIGDGIIRIHRDSKGRKGKGVSVITGFELDEKALKDLAQKIKKQCGCGGTVKNFTIEIQTDNRDQIKTILEKMGHKVKLAGG